MRSNKVFAILIGTGIMLFAIHHPQQPLIEYAFLPALGMMLTCLGVTMYMANNWSELSLGDRRIWIPMLVIVASIVGSSILQVTRGELALFQGLAPCVAGALLFCLYVVCRSLDRDIFMPFTYAVVIGSLGCVVYGIVFPGQLTGGLISPTNYDMATGLLVFGVVVSAIKHQWWLATVAIIGMFFTGSPEAVFAVAMLAIIVLIRRDWSRKLIAPAVVLGIFAIAFLTGNYYANSLYSYTEHKIGTVINTPNEYMIDDALTGRWGRIKEAMGKIQPLGEGYTMTDFNTYTVHNVPLVIVQQIGILGAIAWLWVTLFCLVKTKWKYAWSAVLILSVFDHFMWTQVAPWWWALAGISTTSKIKSDLIFKG